ATSGPIMLVATGQASPVGFEFGAIRNSRDDSEGRFSLSGVAPGQYILLTRCWLPGARGAPAPSAPPLPGMGRTPPLWASADVAVEGQNISGLSLTLQQGMTVSGKVVLQGSTVTP